MVDGIYLILRWWRIWEKKSIKSMVDRVFWNTFNIVHKLTDNEGVLSGGNSKFSDLVFVAF